MAQLSATIKPGDVHRIPLKNGGTVDLSADREVVLSAVVTPGDDWQITVKSDVTQTPTPTPPPPDPKVIWVQGDSLQELLQNAKPGTTFVCTASEQTFDKQVYVDADCDVVSDVGTPIHVKAEQGRQAGVVVRKGARVNLRGLRPYTTYTGTERKACPATFVTYRDGGGHVQDCKSTRLDTLVKCEPGARGVSVTNCETDEFHRGYGVWLDGRDIRIKNCRFRSVIEHPIRMGEDGNPVQQCEDVYIGDCDLSRPANAWKECLSLRKGRNVLVERVKCHLGEPGQIPTTGYALRLGYDERNEGGLHNVTLRNVSVHNGILDCKAGNPKSGLVLDGVTFTGTYPTKWDAKTKAMDPLRLNGVPADVQGCSWNGKPIVG